MHFYIRAKKCFTPELRSSVMRMRMLNVANGCEVLVTCFCLNYIMTFWLTDRVHLPKTAFDHLNWVIAAHDAFISAFSAFGISDLMLLCMVFFKGEDIFFDSLPQYPKGMIDIYSQVDQKVDEFLFYCFVSSKHNLLFTKQNICIDNFTAKNSSHEICLTNLIYSN